jgi:hypothetical protein
MANELAVIDRSNAVATADNPEVIQSRFLPVMSIQTAVQRFKQIQEVVSLLMIEGEHFGTIPGAKKPSLWKPGAEVLGSLFGMVPRYEALATIEDWSGEHHGGEAFFFYRVRCSLYRGDYLMGEGEGSCNSWESKYRTRNAERECPQCGKSSIIKGKAEYGGGYICFAKKGGCGAKFAENDPAIGEQRVGKVANPEIFDLVNTVLKMANKRAQIAATLNATGASRFFTQDIEDIPQFSGEPIDTGGHPVGTQAAANHVRDQKIAEMRERMGGQPAPAPAPPKPAGKSTDFAMLKAFKEIKAKIGSDAYYKILGANGYTKSDEITDTSKGRSIYAEMASCLKAQQERQADEQPAAEIVENESAEVWEAGRE